MGTWSRDLEGYPAVHWFLSQMPNRSNVRRGTGSYMHSHHHPKQFRQLTVFIWKILQGLETAALTLIFDLLRLIVLSEHLLAPVSRSQNPTGSLQNLLFHFRTATCFKKWIKCTVQCALQCILFCQLAKPFISLKNWLLQTLHWLNWTVHCFVCWFARLVMICKVLISLLNNSPPDGAAVFFWIKPNKMSNVAVERWTLIKSWSLRQKF